MRIGVLADIHGHTTHLASAIERFEREGVDRIVVLGDVIEEERNAAETVDLLVACGAAGVWGNHELGLCVGSNEALRRRYPERVLAFFRTLEPRLEVGSALFSHTLPHQDASDPLAYFGSFPEDGPAVGACLARFAHRFMLIGHFHRWFASTQRGPLDWSGASPLTLDETERCLLVVHAVQYGWAAILDLDRSVLTPLRL